MLNKNEHALEMAAPLHDDDGNLVGENTGAAIIQGRSNVLLLGDHLGDLGMSDGVDYDNRISIGFLWVFDDSEIRQSSYFLECLYFKNFWNCTILRPRIANIIEKINGHSNQQDNIEITKF